MRRRNGRDASLVVCRFAQLVHTSVPAREEGQGLVEYGLILAGVSIARSLCSSLSVRESASCLTWSVRA